MSPLLVVCAILAGWVGLSLVAGWLASRWFRWSREP